MLESTQNKENTMNLAMDSNLFSDIIRNIESNVVWRAVFCTIEANQNIHSPEIILSSLSPKLNASLEDVVEAIDGLLKIGLLKMSEQGYNVVNAKFLVPSELTTHSERILNFKDLVNPITSTMEPDGLFDVRQRAFKCNKELAKDLSTEIALLLEKYDKLSDGIESSGIWEFFFGTCQVSNLNLKRKN